MNNSKHPAISLHQTLSGKIENNRSWVGNQNKDELLTFCFENNVWDFRNFIENPYVKKLNFDSIELQWYRDKVKGYLYFLLKSKIYTSVTVPQNNLVTLRQFGSILHQHQIQDASQINRQLILIFLDVYKANSNRTIREKMYNIKNFFEWLGLDSANLVRLRDIPKVSYDNPDWLDEITRNAIKQHLSKIPLPIANHYLIQEYTAARPHDVCQMSLDCLVELKSSVVLRLKERNRRKNRF